MEGLLSVVCPRCGTPLPPCGATWCLPVGRALTLIGGLALVAAYFMPWFATQGIVLTGSFLGQFLGSTNDLRRFLPGSSGGQTEVQLLRALVYLFPASGVLAALLVGLGTVRSSLRTSSNALLALVGLVPLVALILGLSRLPAAATPQIGLWLIGIGSLAISMGAVLDGALAKFASRRL